MAPSSKSKSGHQYSNFYRMAFSVARLPSKLIFSLLIVAVLYILLVVGSRLTYLQESYLEENFGVKHDKGWKRNSTSSTVMNMRHNYTIISGMNNSSDPKSKEKRRNEHLRDRLPAFIVAGTQKGGTLAIYTYLSQHPQILPSNVREPHFFDRVWGRKIMINMRQKLGEGAEHMIYSKFWNVTDLVSNHNLLAFEKTPYYMFDPKVPARIHQIVPHAKIILLLREPVDRLISAFNMNFQKYPRSIVKYEKEHGIHVTIDVCLKIDIEHLTKARIIHDESFWDASTTEVERRQRWNYYFSIWEEDMSVPKFCDNEIGRGLYSLQIQTWISVLGLQEFKQKVFIMRSEQLRPDPVTDIINMNPITDFIGIPGMNITNDIDVRHGHVANVKQPIKEDTKIMLRKLFEPFNKDLQSLLGNEWETPWPMKNEKISMPTV